MSYEDIIHKEHHVSQKHPPMSMLNRAAQFSPFAALTGYDEAVKETARHTDDEILLDETRKEALNATLGQLNGMLEDGQRPKARVTCFLSDDKKSGGAYVTLNSIIRKIDPIEHVITTMEGETILIDRIVEIELFDPSS